MSAKKKQTSKKEKEDLEKKKMSKSKSATAKSSSKKEKKSEEKVQQSEVISTKKVVYIEIDDEVTVVHDRVKSTRGRHVYIVVPKRAIIFQSVVNLKILKRKAEEDNKTIYFITNDQNGMHLAQKVGITIYNKTNRDGGPALFSTEMNDERLRITPLRATVNSVEEAAPTRLSERKLSISEILRKRKGGSKRKNVTVSKVVTNKKKKVKKPRLMISSPNKHALFALISLSMVVLLFIVYIALPGVTVYLTPSASVLEKSVNITLADYEINRAELSLDPVHMIASYPVELTVSTSITQPSTGKEFSSDASNASGVLTISNTTANDWPLVASTRFQTDEGIVFRLPNAVTVPAATATGPGTLEAFVKADPYDALGQIVGERGNIPPSYFFLPGLRESSRSELYAESFVEMTGGTSDYESYVSAEDIEGAKSRLEDTLKEKALDELESVIADRSALDGNGVEYELLRGDKALQFGEVSVSGFDDLEGKQLKEFSLSGEFSVSAVYYDKSEMLAILEDELSLKKSPQKELISVNEDSTTYRIFEWDDGDGKIKLTANIKGIEQYEIDPKKENGARLLEKIREHIAAKDVEVAKNYIQNLPQINKVEIKSWPIWSPTIPKMTDNIDFEIRDAITVD